MAPKPSDPLSKTIIFTGSFSCTSDSTSPISIVKPPSPEREITCRLRADRLRHRVGYGTMVERTDEPALSVHSQIARRPNGWRADIGREDGILVGKRAYDARHMLSMDALVARFWDCEIMEVSTGRNVVRFGTLQELTLLLTPQPRKNRRDRRLHVAGEP